MMKTQSNMPPSKLFPAMESNVSSITRNSRPTTSAFPLTIVTPGLWQRKKTKGDEEGVLYGKAQENDKIYPQESTKSPPNMSIRIHVCVCVCIILSSLSAISQKEQGPVTTTPAYLARS